MVAVQYASDVAMDFTQCPWGAFDSNKYSCIQIKETTAVGDDFCLCVLCFKTTNHTDFAYLISPES